MHRLVAIVTLLTALVAATATASPAATGTPTTFVLAGGGWGHGVGMSQWGAFGQAKAGRGFEQILQHYYRGTELGSAPAAVLDRVRVLVGNGLASVAFTNAIAVFDAEGKRHALPPRPVTVDGKLELPVGKNDKPLALAGPLTFRAARGSYLAVGGKSFRGDLRVAKAGARLQLVNVVGLEDYLLGVVPGEMPKDWPLEALKAQAVAARTYAVAHLVNAKGFDQIGRAHV